MNPDLNNTQTTILNPVSFPAPMKKAHIKKSYVVALVFSLLLLVLGIYQSISQINFINYWHTQGTMQFVENHAVAVDKVFNWPAALQYLVTPVSILLIALVLALVLLSFVRGKTPTNKASKASVIILNIVFVSSTLLTAAMFIFVAFFPFAVFLVGMGLTAYDFIPGSSTVIPILLLVAIILLVGSYTKGKSILVPRKLFGPILAWVAIVIVVGINLVSYLPSTALFKKIVPKAPVTIGGFVTPESLSAVTNFENNKDTKDCAIGWDSAVPCKYLLTKDDVTFEFENNSSSTLSYSPSVIAHVFPAANNGRLSGSCPEAKISSINGSSNFDIPIEGWQKYIVSFSCPDAMPTSLEEFDIGTTMNNGPRYSGAVYSSSIMIQFPK